MPPITPKTTQYLTHPTPSTALVQQVYQPIVIPGFTTADLTDTGNYCNMGFGINDTGKSAFGLTLPKPLAIIQNDPKTGELIESDLLRCGYDPRTILVSRFLSRVEELNGTKYQSLSDDEVKKDPVIKAQIALYRAYVEGVKDAIINAAKHPDIRSVMIDSGTILYEDLLHAHYGRVVNVHALAKSRAAAELMSVVQICCSQRDRKGRRKHIYLTARQSELYVENKGIGVYKPDGCGKLGYFVKNEFNFRKILTGKDITDVANVKGWSPMPKVGDYYVNIHRSAKAPFKAGQAGVAAFMNQDICYQNLMTYLYPDRDPMEFYDDAM